MTFKTLAFQNKTTLPLFTAFGVNEKLGWEDFQSFLEDRCIPKERDGLQYYLQTIGVTNYNPLEIIRKTHGKMAEDHCHIEIIEESND